VPSARRTGADEVIRVPKLLAAVRQGRDWPNADVPRRVASGV